MEDGRNEDVVVELRRSDPRVVGHKDVTGLESPAMCSQHLGNTSGQTSCEGSKTDVGLGNELRVGREECHSEVIALRHDRRERGSPQCRPRLQQ